MLERARLSGLESMVQGSGAHGAFASGNDGTPHGWNAH